jgi:hypothetical protein
VKSTFPEIAPEQTVIEATQDLLQLLCLPQFRTEK